MTFNTPNPETLDLLLGRRSISARRMVDPAPDRAQMTQILTAATRVPDHGKLAPWRYIVLTGDDRAKLGAAIAEALEVEQEASEKVREKMSDYGNQAPMCVIAVFSPNHGRPIPLFEQQLSMGASIMTMITAAHALGFVANWLTGWGSTSKTVAAKLGLADHESIAGFIFMGSEGEAPTDRPRPDLDTIVQWDL